MKSVKYKALSLFSGIGGMCEGFRLAGFNLVGAVENDQFAAANYRQNFPGTPLYEGDIHEFLAGSIESKEHRSRFVGDETDVLFGGPPCQGYSQIGPRDLDDPRNDLYRQFTRVARETSARVLVIENVPNMFLMNNGHFKHQIFRELRRSGYDNIGWKKLNAAEFGVPQERNRIFILATSTAFLAIPMQDILEGAALALQRPGVTVGQAIGDLPDKPVASGEVVAYPKSKKLSAFQREMRLDGDGVFYSKLDKTRQYRKSAGTIGLHNHHTKDIQARRLKLIKLLKPGLKADSLPKEIWDNARPEKWRRLNASKPSHTLMAQMHRDLSEWVHPRLHRWITVREAMRIQSFHDGFVLGTSEWQQLKQIGNAVPPLLAYVPAMAARYALAVAARTKLPFELKGQQGLFKEA